MKALWVADSDWDLPVTVRGERRDGGEPILISRGRPTPFDGAVLDPAKPGVPYSEAVPAPFKEWPSLLYFPMTGCYDLTVEWAGGGWTATIPFVAPDEIPGFVYATPTG